MFLITKLILDKFEDFENYLSPIVLRINQKLQNTHVSCIELLQNIYVKTQSVSDEQIKICLHPNIETLSGL